MNPNDPISQCEESDWYDKVVDPATKRAITYENLQERLAELEDSDSPNLVELLCVARSIQHLETEFPELGKTRTSGLSQLIHDKDDEIGE